jgi:hypothetical protein
MRCGLGKLAKAHSLLKLFMVSFFLGWGGEILSNFNLKNMILTYTEDFFIKIKA